jgi:methionyl-tRNA formyltransferase
MRTLFAGQNAMRSVLIGCVEGSDTALETMIAAGHPPVAILTLQPEIGKVRHVDYVDLRALARGIPVIDGDDINDAAIVEKLEELQIDYIFVIGWSQLLHQPIRATAKKGVVGFHPTLLPNLRGRGAIAWTILTAPARAGVSLFVIDGDGADTGPIVAQHSFALDARETAASLIEKNKRALHVVLRDILPELAAARVDPCAQNEAMASVATRRTAADARIDWLSPAAEIDRLIRAQSEPYSGAFTFTRKRKLRVWEARDVTPPVRYIGFPGQVVQYRDGRPLILCGDGRCLDVDRYSADDPAYRLTGQIRLFDRLGDDQ